MAEVVRIGPQHAEQPVALNPGDVLEVLLPEQNISTTWQVYFDRGFFWIEDEDGDQIRWILEAGSQLTVRSLLALSAGRCVIHCEQVDLFGRHKSADAIDFIINIGSQSACSKKARPAKRTASPSQPAAPRHKPEIPLAFDSQARLQELETENSWLQERLCDLSRQVTKLAEENKLIKPDQPRRPRHA